MVRLNVQVVNCALTGCLALLLSSRDMSSAQAGLLLTFSLEYCGGRWPRQGQADQEIC